MTGRALDRIRRAVLRPPSPALAAAAATALAATALAATALAAPALAPTVKVSPLGGVDGEFCPQDRALVFEDPNGTPVLYDPGRTAAGMREGRHGA